MPSHSSVNFEAKREYNVARNFKVGANRGVAYRDCRNLKFFVEAIVLRRRVGQSVVDEKPHRCRSRCIGTTGNPRNLHNYRSQETTVGRIGSEGRCDRACPIGGNIKPC